MAFVKGSRSSTSKSKNQKLNGPTEEKEKKGSSEREGVEGIEGLS